MTSLPQRRDSPVSVTPRGDSDLYHLKWRSYLLGVPRGDSPTTTTAERDSLSSDCHSRIRLSDLYHSKRALYDSWDYRKRLYELYHLKKRFSDLHHSRIAVSDLCFPKRRLSEEIVVLGGDSPKTTTEKRDFPIRTSYKDNLDNRPLETNDYEPTSITPLPLPLKRLRSRPSVSVFLVETTPFGLFGPRGLEEVINTDESGDQHLGSSPRTLRSVSTVGPLCYLPRRLGTGVTFVNLLCLLPFSIFLDGQPPTPDVLIDRRHSLRGLSVEPLIPPHSYSHLLYFHPTLVHVTGSGYLDQVKTLRRVSFHEVSLRPLPLEKETLRPLQLQKKTF